MALKYAEVQGLYARYGSRTWRQFSTDPVRVSAPPYNAYYVQRYDFWRSGSSYYYWAQSVSVGGLYSQSMIGHGSSITFKPTTVGFWLEPGEKLYASPWMEKRTDGNFGLLHTSDECEINEVTLIKPGVYSNNDSYCTLSRHSDYIYPYHDGEETWAKCVPDSGYRFVRWRNSAGTTLSTSQKYTWEPASNNVTTVYAEISKEYKLTVTASPTAATVSGGGTFIAGQKFTVKTSYSNSRYYFDGWYKGNTKVSGNTTYTGTMGSANLQLVAKYVKYASIKIYARPSGTTAGSGKITSSISSGSNTNAYVKPGSSVTIQATIKDTTNYYFLGWFNADSQNINNRVSSSLSYTFTASGSNDYNFYAWFIQKNLLTVKAQTPEFSNVKVESVNYVSSFADAVSCRLEPLVDYVTAYAQIELDTTKPDLHYTFSHWAYEETPNEKLHITETYSNFLISKNTVLLACLFENFTKYKVQVGFWDDTWAVDYIPTKDELLTLNDVGGYVSVTRVPVGETEPIEIFNGTQSEEIFIKWGHDMTIYAHAKEKYFFYEMFCISPTGEVTKATTYDTYVTPIMNGYNGLYTYVLMFKNASIHTIQLEVDDEGANVGNLLAITGHSGIHESGDYYSGSIDITSYPAPGWRVKQWNLSYKINDEWMPSESVVEGDKDFGIIYHFRLIYDSLVKGFFEKIKYSLKCVIDEPSKPFGNVTIKYKESIDGEWYDYNEFYHTLFYGSYLKFIATPKDDTVEFMGYYVGDVLFEGSSEYEIMVENDIDLICKFGSTVSLHSRLVGTDESIADATLQTWTEGFEDDKDAGVKFIFGEKVFINTYSTSSYFIGWVLNDYNKEIPQYVPTWKEFVEFVPTSSNINLYAVYDNNPYVYYVELANQGAASVFQLLLQTLTGKATQLTQKEYLDLLYQRYPANRSPAPTPVIGEKRYYYAIESKTSILLNISQIMASTYDFLSWGIEYLIPQDIDGVKGYYLSPETTLSSNREHSLVVDSDCIINAYFDLAGDIEIQTSTLIDSSSMGEVDMFPKKTPQSIIGGISDKYSRGTEITIVAYPMNGFIFDGWYTSSSATPESLIQNDKNPEYRFVLNNTSSLLTFFAKFIPDTSSVWEWEGNNNNKNLVWTSRRYDAPFPYNPSVVQVFSDTYENNGEVQVQIDMSSSPDDFSREMIQTTKSFIRNQDARRLPRMRPEKYLEFTVTSNDTIEEITISSSMGGLIV